MSSCDSETPALKSYEEAVDLLLDAAPVIGDVERVSLEHGIGRILARPVLSAIDVPSWDYSAMDGYAVRSADVPSPGTLLPVSQRIPAGTAPPPLQPGTAARIFTGGPIPLGADAIVIQEVCEPVGDGIRIIEAPQPGAEPARTSRAAARSSRPVPRSSPSTWDWPPPSGWRALK